MRNKNIEINFQNEEETISQELSNTLGTLSANKNNPYMFHEEEEEEK